MSVRKWMFAGALLLAAGLSSLGFAQKPGLKFNPDKKFKIVQFTDSWESKPTYRYKRS